MGKPIASLISKLTQVKKGDPLTADRINAIQDLLIGITRGDNIMRGDNILKRSGGSWVSLSSIVPFVQNTGNQIAGPWEILKGVSSNQEEGQDVDTVRVSTNSTLMSGLDLNSEITITGIDDDFTLARNQVLYLQLTYNDSGGVDSVSLVGDDQWDEYPNVTHIIGSGSLDDPFRVSISYFPIAYAYDIDDADDLEGINITDADGNKVKVVRLCFTPLVLRFEDPGAGFIIPYPSAGTRFGGQVVP